MRARRPLHLAVGPTSLPLCMTTPERPVVPPALWTRAARAGLRPLTEREMERALKDPKRLEALVKAIEDVEAREAGKGE